MPVRASQLTGDEREHALAHFLTQTMRRQYQARADRELRLFALVRAPPSAASCWRSTRWLGWHEHGTDQRRRLVFHRAGTSG